MTTKPTHREIQSRSLKETTLVTPSLQGGFFVCLEKKRLQNPLIFEETGVW